MRAWWLLLVVMLIVIADLVAGMVVLATKKETALPLPQTITGQPAKTSLFYVKSAAAVPDHDFVWHDAYTPSNIPGINCTLKVALYANSGTRSEPKTLALRRPGEQSITSPLSCTAYKSGTTQSLCGMNTDFKLLTEDGFVSDSVAKFSDS